MKHIPELLVAFCLILASATAQKPAKVLSDLNARLDQIQKGYFDISWSNKTFTSEDSTHAAGRVYFFRERELDDTMSLFIMRDTSQVRFSYDGDRYYYVDKLKKEVTYKPLTPAEGIINALSGNKYRSNFAFFPYLNNAPRGHFKLKDFEGATLKKLKNGRIQITLKEAFANPLKGQASDPDSGHYQLVLTLLEKGPELLQMDEHVWINDMVQFKQTVFSPIQTLPGNASFDQFFDLRKFENDGYAIQAQQAPASQDPTLAPPGAKVPEFALPPGVSPSSRLILLDFWYMACGPCILSMPHIDSLYQSYRDKGLLVLGVNKHDNDKEKARAFLQKRGGSYPTVFEDEVNLIKPLGVKAYPSIVLFDPVSREVLLSLEGAGPNGIQKLRDILDDKLK